MARQTRRQFQFTNFELAMIAGGFLVATTAIFFLGLYVGKKNASYHTPVEDRVARVPVDDFTRYKRPAPLPPPVPKEHREPAAEAPAATAAANAAGAPAAGSVPASPKAEDAAKAAATTPIAAAEAAKPAADAAAKDTAAKAKAAKDAADKEAAREKDKDKEEEPTGRGYTVQILATRKSGEADELARKLKSHGYAAYIKKVGDGGGAWYRVRVGSYGAFSEARAMADRCRRDMGLGQAFVSTE